jgi:RNA polymerase sigma-70 factor, ECF subfamily
VSAQPEDAPDDSGVLRVAPSNDLISLSSADLFASYQGRIRRYILSMVHDPVDADDLTQEVFLRAHRKLSSIRDPASLTSWLYRIATNICYDRYRRASRQPRLDPLDPTGANEPRPRPEESDETGLDRVIERGEMSACVRSYLDGLSDEYRQVILLHDLEGMTNPEIAEMLGASLDAVKIRLHRARRKLQTTLTANCDFSHDEDNVLVCEPAAAPVELTLAPRRRG